MPTSPLCKYCKRFNEANGECSKRSVEIQCGPRLKLFIDTAPINNDLPKWVRSDDGIPPHVILNPMSALIDPKQIIKIEIGD